MNDKINKYALSDEDMSKVDGGQLPMGWQFVINKGIKDFKATPEAEIIAMGFTKDANGMINYILAQGYAEQLGLNDADIETVKNYILKNY